MTDDIEFTIRRFLARRTRVIGVLLGDAASIPVEARAPALWAASVRWDIEWRLRQQLLHDRDYLRNQLRESGLTLAQLEADLSHAERNLAGIDRVFVRELGLMHEGQFDD